MYEEIEDSWTVDSGDYDDIIQKQLSNRRDVEHWEKELEEILGEKPLRILDIGCGPGFLTWSGISYSDSEQVGSLCQGDRRICRDG